MIYSLLLAISFLIVAVEGGTAHPSYMAVIDEVVGTNSNVSGMVAVFSDDATIVAFAATLEGLEPNLEGSLCSGADNGCGVNIRTGKDCFDAASQGGHFFAGDVDPWKDVRYTTDKDGAAYKSDVLTIGTGDLVGRVVVVHSSDGSPVGCGLIQRVPFPMTTTTEPLVDPAVESKVTVFQTGDTACFYGSATNLERNIQSFLLGGDDCFSKNGCGAHIRAGLSCFNDTTRQGPHYNAAIVGTNPWERVGYLTTSRFGASQFTACVKTGARQIQGRVFLLHASDGTRVSCGLLELPDPTAPPGPTEPPVITPTNPTATTPAPKGPPSGASAPTDGPVVSTPVPKDGTAVPIPPTAMNATVAPSLSKSPSTGSGGGGNSTAPEVTNPSNDTNATKSPLITPTAVGPPAIVPTRAPINTTTVSKASSYSVSMLALTIGTFAATLLSFLQW